MNNTRGAIIDNLKTGLEGITKPNDYDINISKVFLYAATDTAVRNAGDNCIIVVDNGDVEIKRFSSYNTAVLNVQLEIHSDNMSLLISNVRHYLNVASLGDNCRYVYDNDIEPPDKSINKENPTMNIQIGYWYDRSNP